MPHFTSKMFQLALPPIVNKPFVIEVNATFYIKNVPAQMTDVANIILASIHKTNFITDSYPMKSVDRYSTNIVSSK